MAVRSDQNERCQSRTVDASEPSGLRRVHHTAPNASGIEGLTVDVQYEIVLEGAVKSGNSAAALLIQGSGPNAALVADLATRLESTTCLAAALEELTGAPATDEMSTARP